MIQIELAVPLRMETWLRSIGESIDTVNKYRTTSARTIHYVTIMKKTTKLTSASLVRSSTTDGHAVVEIVEYLRFHKQPTVPFKHVSESTNIRRLILTSIVYE